MISYNLGFLEQEVMDYIWGKEKVRVRDVYNFLRDRRKIAYTTVMTV